MDPQQRILLELVWHATEDAGIPASRLAGSATGVYIGGSSTDYRDLRLGDPASGDSYFMTGATLSILANRISYVFDLHGPSLTVDTACSSSLVALHHACEAIRDGQIGTAIVGGINLLLSPYPFLGFSRASMLSRRGHCFAFDERADGYVRGEGGGVVILKPLAQALADGDRVRAVILGTGVNSDGRTIGLSLPNEAAQSALIRAVCERAGVMPDEFAFFEMHGTGTPGRRSDRGRRGRTRARPGPAQDAADRLGQEQYRPSRTGIRNGRADQGGAGARTRRDAAVAALRDAEPEDPVRRTQSAAGARDRTDFGRTLRRRQFVRFWRNQRARRAGCGAPPAGQSRRRGNGLCRRWSSRPAARPRCGHSPQAGATRSPRRHPTRSARCCAAPRAAASICRNASSRSAPTGTTSSPRSPISPPGRKARRSCPAPPCATRSWPSCSPATAPSGRAWGATPTRRAPRSATRSASPTPPCAPGWAGRSARCWNAAPTRSNWCTPISPSRCSSRCRSASSRCCAGSGSRRRPASATASARSAPPGPPARYRWPMPRESSSRAAGSRNVRAAAAAWRPWRWAPTRRARFSPRSAARSNWAP